MSNVQASRGYRGLSGEESAWNAEDMGWILVWEDFPGEENSNPLQYSCLGNPMDRGACWATVHGVAKESDMTEQLSMHRMGMLREGNGEGCGTLAVARIF